MTAFHCRIGHAAGTARILVEDCCTLQGMACVRSGQAPAWPLVSDRRGCRGSDAQGVGPEDAFCEAVLERIFGCPLTVEGHPRTLSGPSPDLSPLGRLHFSRCNRLAM